MFSKIIIELTDIQVERIKIHLKTQSEANQMNETFSGYTFMLSATEDGLSWLELDMNTRIDIGDVNWRIE
jgi:hypothetical protein